MRIEMTVKVAVLRIIMNCIPRRFQLAKKGGQLQQGGNHHTHEPPTCQPVNDFHQLEGYGPGNENEYETVGDLDLTLQQVPNSGNKRNEVNQMEAGHVYDNASQPPARGESAVQQPCPSTNVSENRGSKSTQPHHSPDDPTWQKARGENGTGDSRLPTPAVAEERPPQPESSEGEGSPEGRSPTGEEGEKKLPGKKEKFVAKVLDQTLESIIGQREALAATPEFQGAAGEDSNSDQPRDPASAKNASTNLDMLSTTLGGSKDSLNVSDNSKNPSSGGNLDNRRHRKDRRSPKHDKLTEDREKIGETGAGEQEVELYAVPKKPRPVSKLPPVSKPLPVSDSGSSERSSRDGGDAGAVWASHVDSSA